MDFEIAHEEFIRRHADRRSGERKGRLLRGHQYAEKLLLRNVWWPLFGSFDHLHPEYEIFDWNRKSQFLDFAFLPAYGKFGIECDGYQSHVKDMDRERFSYSLNRENFLTGMGWRMVHFSFDDVQNRPEICRSMLQLIVGPHLMKNAGAADASAGEKEVLRLAWSLGRRVRPIDVTARLGMDFRTARKRLQAMVGKGWLQPVPSGRGVLYYELKEGTLDYLL
ncbi:PDDEXK family nuclease [Paenibacillus arenilitoris]|uniref:DUF559 domain-containing protein n=1 Tax=Paenibacillus arenilitoris TaxID=2772299 RepID=A0A927H744_9BACL|nr:hypothetical protein [Paenibacillus arenilitoris]MBD2870650.1 hypothetical protein [Paenibacillus arenilitoris]